MTDTEAKAREVIRSIRATMLTYTMGDSLARSCAYELERALEREARHAAELREQAERFSEAVCSWRDADTPTKAAKAAMRLHDFILHKPAPDPLVEVMDEMGLGQSKTASKEFLAAIEKRGGRIVWGDDQ